MKKYLPVFFAVLFLFVSGCTEKQAYAPLPTVTPVTVADIPAADICFYDDKQAPFDLSDAFGTPILLKFWSAGHPDAEAEMRALIHAYEKQKDNVLFCLIDLTPDSAVKQALFEQHPDIVPPFPCYFDPDGSCQKAYEITGTQASFFIDRDGFLATWVDGSITEEALLFGLKMI